LHLGEGGGTHGAPVRDANSARPGKFQTSENFNLSQHFPLNLFDQMTHQHAAHANLCAPLQNGSQEFFARAIYEGHAR